MVRKVFWEDPYLTTLTTHVTSVEGNNITVDSTIFYAFSGGQESDKGTFNNYEVIKASKHEHEIIYTIEDHQFQVGDEVIMKIDWQRRYRLMRLHFAAELILELAYQYAKGIEKIGAHISSEKARIDFIWDKNISQMFEFLESQVCQLVKEDHEIISEFSDEDNERRYWKIEGFSQVSCGGTHLKKTSEIGNIKLKRVNIGKGKERIEIYLEGSC